MFTSKNSSTLAWILCQDGMIKTWFLSLTFLPQYLWYSLYDFYAYSWPLEIPYEASINAIHHLSLYIFCTIMGFLLILKSHFYLSQHAFYVYRCVKSEIYRWKACWISKPHCRTVLLGGCYYCYYYYFF